MLTVPIVDGIVGTIIADANTTATQATVAGFVGTIYVLGVLIWCVRSFVAHATKNSQAVLLLQKPGDVLPGRLAWGPRTGKRGTLPSSQVL